MFWLRAGLCSGALTIPLIGWAESTSAARVAAYDVGSWLFGLVVVLALFLALAWLFKQVSGGQTLSQGKLKVIAVLPLGLREKVLLLQVGRKQLVLGVTPGRIETLHVLEGDDCVASEPAGRSVVSPYFADKLNQALKAKADVKSKP
ncbi:flagellar biosynthetic protein FliO [Methylocucumis oryzae]|uniref:flagellar biosynthetic protein FliO n=1 Tax=Methylocucumis oryzae TaxID=1632867 RepID=UPI000696C9AE|nr:flagellar biosynthetic protein FliO [Methylocucumis oryzae]